MGSFVCATCVHNSRSEDSRNFKSDRDLPVEMLETSERTDEAAFHSVAMAVCE